MKSIWQTIKLPLKFLVTGVLLYFAFRRMDFAELQQVYRQSTPLLFVFAMVAFAAAQVVSSWRLLGFFKAKGLLLPFWYNLKLYFLGMFYNLFLPGGIGGDGYKIYLLRARFGTPGRKLLSAVFLDRLSGVWGMAGIALLFLLQLPEIAIPALIPVSLYAIGSVVYFTLLRLFFKLDFSTIVSGHLKAIVVQALQVLSVVMLLLALNLEGWFVPYLFTFLVSSLVSVFPFTVGGLGAREYVFVLSAGVLPMEIPIALSVSLSFYMISLLVALVGVYFVFRSKEFALTAQESEDIKREELAQSRSLP